MIKGLRLQYEDDMAHTSHQLRHGVDRDGKRLGHVLVVDRRAALALWQLKIQ